MITPGAYKGDSTELFQYDGQSPFVYNRPKTATNENRSQNHHYHVSNSQRHDRNNNDDMLEPYPTYLDSSHSMANNNFRQDAHEVAANNPTALNPTGQSPLTDNYRRHNNHDNMRWPSLVSLPASMSEVVKKGTHLISDSWREIKQLSHLDSPTESGDGGHNRSIMGTTAPGAAAAHSSSSLVYDCLMSELRDALKTAEKLKDQREAEERKAKNLPDYSWLMDPTMRERKRYKMPPEEANQVNALCWRLAAEDCNTVLRRFRERMEKERRLEDEEDDGEILLPSSVPSIFKSILNDVIVEREMQQHKQSTESQQENTAPANNNYNALDNNQQQSWSEWLHEKFTGSMLNLGSIAFGSGNTNEAPSTSRAFGGGNRVVPMTTLHTLHENEDAAKPPAAHEYEQRVQQQRFMRGDSVQSDATSSSNLTMYDARGYTGDDHTPAAADRTPHKFQQHHSLQPSETSSTPHRNASAADLTCMNDGASGSNTWAAWGETRGAAPAFHRSVSTASTATITDKNTPGTHFVNFSQLNPAALMHEHNNNTQSQQQNSMYVRDFGGDGNGDDFEGGQASGNRRESTVSEDGSIDSVLSPPFDDDESRQEVGGGWNWFKDNDGGVNNTNNNVPHTAVVVRQNERSRQLTNNVPFHY